MRNFKCRKCMTKYSSPDNTIPPSPKWNDGHICEMEEIHHEENEGKYVRGRD